MKQQRVKTIMRWVGGVFGVLIAATGITLGAAYYVYSQELPDDSALRNWTRTESTRIYDRHGVLLYEVYGDEKRVWIDDSAISPLLKQATIAIEDKRFYEHNGFDPRGVLRAFWVNTQAGEYVQGGSTITQQLAKNAFLTSKRTWERKAKELLLAIRLERVYTKDQILSLYLNEVGYGSNVYGAEAAAQMYFGKPAKDLTLHEAATLAALTKAPTIYSPYTERGRARLVERKKIVLDEMVRLGYISQSDAEAAANTEIAVRPREEKILAPHFVMHVREQLIAQYGEDVVEAGGLEVTTTLDYEKQQAAEKIVSEMGGHIEAAGGSNAATVAIDPKSGEIIAMVGSRDYFDTARDGNVNVATSKRPPGSSFKPIVYATAFMNGKWGPGSVLFDVETDFGDSYRSYIPNNYDGRFHGAVSIRQALANSYNIPAVKMLLLVGKDKVVQTASQLGIASLTDAERYGASLALGGGDVTLLELTGAYSSFANNGHFATPHAIKKVVRQGEVVYEHNQPAREVVRPQVAYQITSILADNDARATVFGRRSPLVIPNRNVAAKTGTSQDYRDAWTVGYAPNLAVGVWVGNNDYSPMKSGSAGAMAAAPVWNRVMSQLLQSLPNESFVAPSGLEVLTVDAVTGRQPTAGTRQTHQDIFAEWQKPDPIELASYAVFGCDGNRRETRYGYVIRSERPDDPKWEQGVIAWARAHGYPTGSLSDVRESCPVSAPEPEIAQSEPSEQSVGGAEPVEVSVPEPEVAVPEVIVPVTPEPVVVPEPVAPPTPEPRETPDPPRARNRDREQ